MCLCNQDTLTVRHFLYDCPLYDTLRGILQDELAEVHSNFRDYQFFHNLNNLLFPHTMFAKEDLRKKDNLSKRYKLLKILLIYCQGRFSS